MANDFGLGEYRAHDVVEMGYEDFNVVLTTAHGKYFVKCFAAWRGEQERERYVEIMEKAIEAGVRHPKLYQSNQGHLHAITIDGVQVWLCVLEFVSGKTFYESNQKPAVAESQTPPAKRVA